MAFTAGMAIGILFGVVIGFTIAIRYNARPRSDDGELSQDERCELARLRRESELTPEQRFNLARMRQGPGAMYRPPVIVLAVPREVRAVGVVPAPQCSTAVARR